MSTSQYIQSRMQSTAAKFINRYGNPFAPVVKKDIPPSERKWAIAAAKPPSPTIEDAPVQHKSAPMKHAAVLVTPASQKIQEKPAEIQEKQKIQEKQDWVTVARKKPAAVVLDTSSDNVKVAAVIPQKKAAVLVNPYAKKVPEDSEDMRIVKTSADVPAKEIVAVKQEQPLKKAAVLVRPTADIKKAAVLVKPTADIKKQPKEVKKSPSEVAETQEATKKAAFLVNPKAQLSSKKVTPEDEEVCQIASPQKKKEKKEVTKGGKRPSSRQKKFLPLDLSAVDERMVMELKRTPQFVPTSSSTEDYPLLSATCSPSPTLGAWGASAEDIVTMARSRSVTPQTVAESPAEETGFKGVVSRKINPSPTMSLPNALRSSPFSFMYKEEPCDCDEECQCDCNCHKRQEVEIEDVDVPDFSSEEEDPEEDY